MQTPRESPQEITASPWWLKPWFLAVVLAVYVVSYFAFTKWVWSRFGGIDNAGIFGDMFGAFNAFASGLAMLGVIAAILLQRDQNRMQAQELKLQRQELELTRKELEGQKEALQEQNAQARRNAEAAIMSQLMVEYDSMRDSIRMLQDFHRRHTPRENAIETFRRGRTVPDQTNPIATEVDPARFRVSRFFVRVRKLSTGGYLSEDLIWSALSREAIEDVFLSLIDPLDQVVNEIAGRRRSVADYDFYQRLLSQHQTSGG